MASLDEKRAWLAKLGGAGHSASGSAAAGSAAAPAISVSGRASVFESGDEGPQPVSMRLPEPGEKPARKPAASKKPVVINFDAEEEAKPKNMGVVMGYKSGEVKEVADFVKLTANQNLQLLGEAIHGACDDFATYTDDKIEKLKKVEEINDLIIGIAETVVKAVGGGLAGMAVEGIGLEVVKVITEVVTHEIAEKAKTAGKDDSKGFKAMVTAMTNAAKDAHTKFENRTMPLIGKNVDVAYNAVQTAERERKPPSDAEMKFIRPFLGVNPSQKELLLQRHFGIPTSASAQKIRMKVYADMIEKFMEKYVIATNPGLLVEWNISGGYQPKMYAHRAAVKEKQERSKALGIQDE